MVPDPPPAQITGVSALTVLKWISDFIKRSHEEKHGSIVTVSVQSPCHIIKNAGKPPFIAGIMIMQA